MSMKKDFLRLSHLTRDEGWEIIDRTRDIKQKTQNRIKYTPLSGKTLAMIFEKPSTRTRVSFEVGIYQLGGMALYLSSNDLQLSRGESVSDTAKVLSRYVDMVMIRAFSQDMVEEFAKNAEVPVINGLTDLTHPCQVMSDVYTISEISGKNIGGIKVVYLGDGNNVANSWINAAVLFGFGLTIACPEELMPNSEILKVGLEKSAGKIKIIHDPKTAVSDADVIYTDTWLSMGDDEGKRGWKLDILGGYQLNSELLSHAQKDTMVMHCLPAHRGEEITDDVMDGESSVVFPQAENRLHVQKAIMDILNERREKIDEG